MPKFLVEMNYVVSYGTKFVIESDDAEMADDILHSMDSDILEKTLPWACNNYESPLIHSIAEVRNEGDNVLINSHPAFMVEYNKIKKEIYDETSQG